jgi:hypothetical protein
MRDGILELRNNKLMLTMARQILKGWRYKLKNFHILLTSLGKGDEHTSIFWFLSILLVLMGELKGLGFEIWDLGF